MEGFAIGFINENAAKIFMGETINHCNDNLINQSINMFHFQKLVNKFYDKIVGGVPTKLCVQYGENSYYTKEILPGQKV